MLGKPQDFNAALTAENIAIIRDFIAVNQASRSRAKPWNFQRLAKISKNDKAIVKGLESALINKRYELAFYIAMNTNPSFAIGLLCHSFFMDLDPASPEVHNAAFYAISFKNTKALAHLLKTSSLDPNIKNKEGDTLLHYAIKHDNQEIVNLLLKLKSTINCNEIDAYGNTALMLAASKGLQAKNLYRFVRHGTNLKQINQAGESAIDIALKHNNAPLALAIQKLINSELLDEAVRNNNIKLATHILKSMPVNLNTANRYKKTPLMVASASGNLDMVILLCEHGAKIDPIINDNTALMLAAVGNHRDVMRYLIAMGANCEAITKHGNTALLRAALSGCEPETVHTLKVNGANFRATNIKGQNLLDLALLSANKALSAYLMKEKSEKTKETDLIIDVALPFVHFLASPRSGKAYFNPMSPAHKIYRAQVLSPCTTFLAIMSPRTYKRKPSTPYTCSLKRD